MRSVLRVLGVVAAVATATALLAAPVRLPSVTSNWFTPGVIPDDIAVPVRLEASVSESPASVVFEYDGVDRAMFDNGTNGDLVAGDGIWTVLFQPNEILSKLTAASVFRPFIGYVKPAGTTAKTNAFAQIWTSAIGTVPVRQLGNGDQQTDYLMNVIVSAADLQSPSYLDRSKRLYAHYSDLFDFLNIINVNGPNGNRFHSVVRNDVSGIGLSLTDGSSAYGSRGRLRGFSAFPIPSLFDGASAAYNHELGHQWINFVGGSPVADGIPHWPKGDIAINVMGFSIGGPSGQGGTYSFLFTPNGSGGYNVTFNPAPNSNTVTFGTLELYLMGLVTPAEVGTFFRLNDQNMNLVNGQVLQPSDITQFGVNDIIAAAGVRSPSSGVSPKDYRAATIVASSSPLDAKTMAFYDYFARRSEAGVAMPCSEGFAQYTCKPFALATGNRATLTTRMADDEFRRAAFDPAYQAPACRALSDSCETTSLVVGRSTITGGAETNQPNTVADSCADVGGGVFHASPSIDKLSVSTADGSIMAAGKTVRASATVWINNAATDRLDLYYSASASVISWNLIGTVLPSGTGLQVLSANYGLPPGATQVVRAHLRSGGAGSSCGVGFSDDHDDLVFAVGVAPGSNIVANPSFSSGLGNWTAYGQNPGDITASVTDGVLSFTRAVPPAGQSNQAAVLQTTGVAYGASQAIAAQFDLGNSSAVRKRVSVLIIDSDFSDITVCTFWLEAGAPLRTYGMRTHTREAWTNAAIYFYAATTGVNGGAYLVDNVLMAADNSASAFKTECLDPTAPLPDLSADGPELLTNPSFITGNTNGWSVFQKLTSNVTASVFQFIRPTADPDPAGGILQFTNTAPAAGTVLTAHFQLGNSSLALRRVTVLLHDLDFQDLSACTYWLPPSQPLMAYTMRSFTTKSWTNATISFYAATAGDEQWTRLDNVSLKVTNGQTTSGTDCISPGAPEGSAPIDPDAAASLSSGSQSQSLSPAVFTPFAFEGSVDLRTAIGMNLSLASRLAPPGTHVAVQVSTDGLTWRTLAAVPATDELTWFDVDVDALESTPLWVRFVFVTFQ